MKFLELKRDIIGIVEKVQVTSSDTGIHNKAITVLHEQWMCLGKQKHTHITLCNLVTLYISIVHVQVMYIYIHAYSGVADCYIVCGGGE